MKKAPTIVEQAREEIRKTGARAQRIGELEQQLADQRARANNSFVLADERHKQVEEMRKQFADLKERLHNSEMENQRLRGYVERVQEDDVVREELVQTGDPNGEQRLVSKRKLTTFRCDPTPVGWIGSHDEYGRERPKSKHWVNY